MATDMPAETGAARDAETHAAHDRWKRMWSHREHLLKVARRRSMSLEDAEDAVHEAMLRAAERPDLDDERLGAWLTTVTMRLCVDRYRQVNREAEVRSSPTLLTPGPVPVDEAVCDRAEARWLAVRSGELPARQAEALRLKSEDLDVGQVAVRMGLSYRTVESLLARARRTLRASLAGTLGAVLFLLGRGRPSGAGKAQTVAVTSTAATLVVAGFVLPQTLGGGGGATEAPVPRPAVSQSAEPLRTGSTGSTDRLHTPRAHTVSQTKRAPAGRETARTPGTGSPLPLSVPSLPEVSSAPLPTLSAPGVSGVPTVPKLPVPSAAPSLPSVPTGIPSLPSASLPVPTPSTPSVKLP